jgi:hypothetical protein
MNSPQVNINLIGRPKVEFSTSFVKWTFNVGRIVIALTELVALGALGYRFYIDRTIIDLHDQIKKDQIFVSSQADKEKNYIGIQNRLAYIKNVNQDTGIKINLLNEILNTISSGSFKSNNISIDQNSISIDGTAFSIFTINQFIKELKNNKSVSSISLDNFTSAPSGIQFKLTIEIKQK